MLKDLSKNLIKRTRSNQEIKVAIIRSNYHKDLTLSLEKACRKYLLVSGVREQNISTYEASGSWEIPLLAQKIARLRKFDGIIAFGVIIKGETYHFEMIANECARALMNISLEFDIPITFEILATYNIEQAKRRSKGKYNKGIEAAQVVLETIKTLKKL